MFLTKNSQIVLSTMDIQFKNGLSLEKQFYALSHDVSLNHSSLIKC